MTLQQTHETKQRQNIHRASVAPHHHPPTFPNLLETPEDHMGPRYRNFCEPPTTTTPARPPLPRATKGSNQSIHNGDGLGPRVPLHNTPHTLDFVDLYGSLLLGIEFTLRIVYKLSRHTGCLNHSSDARSSSELGGASDPSGLITVGLGFPMRRRSCTRLHSISSLRGHPFGWSLRHGQTPWGPPSLHFPSCRGSRKHTSLIC